MHTGTAAIVILTGLVLSAIVAAAAEGGAQPLAVTLRSSAAGADGAFLPARRQAAWGPAKTAAIVCDMWDQHWCKGASARVAEMAPRMDELLRRLRDTGVLIIHAPSACMKAYQDHPARKRALDAPKAPDPPNFLARWAANLDSEKGAVWPIDQADGGCDDEPKCKSGSPWRRQIEAIHIADQDAITDSGIETWNLLTARGIENVLVMGVHTNMCVIGRPFGLRNLKRAGKNVVLVRDMTDTMYNSRSRPFVSHFRGTELVVEYIEGYVCPTVLSSDLTRKAPMRFEADSRPRIVLAVAEKEYQTWRTLPEVLGQTLGDRYGCSVSMVYGQPEENRDFIPGFAEELSRADLVLLSIRRRALPAGDLAALRRHLEAGKGLLAIRTSSHAFNTKGKHAEGHEEWPDFDHEVLGCRYNNHHGAGPAVAVALAAGAKDHLVVAGLPASFTSKGSLYRSAPLADDATALLTGTIPNQPPEPVAWGRTYKKARIFYTSLGHPDDFAGEDPPLVRMLVNAAFWAMNRPLPTAAARVP